MPPVAMDLRLFVDSNDLEILSTHLPFPSTSVSPSVSVSISLCKHSCILRNPRRTSRAYRWPLNLISRYLNGTYITALTPNATSNPISPAVLASGPTNQTWCIDGTMSATEQIPAPSAASPVGSFLGLFQIFSSYLAGSLRRNHKCSTSTMAT